jgi:hypothetical protein
MEIRAIHEAAVTARLSRAALMVGIDERIVAGLPREANMRDQVFVDIGELNKIVKLADGNMPMWTWLNNAAHLAEPREEAAIFARYRDRISEAPPIHEGQWSTDP